MFKCTDLYCNHNLLLFASVSEFKAFLIIFHKTTVTALTDSSLFLPIWKALSDFSLFPIHIGICSIKFPVKFNNCKFVKFSKPSIFVIQFIDKLSSFSFRSLSSFSIFSIILLLRINTCSLFIRSKFSMYCKEKKQNFCKVKYSIYSCSHPGNVASHKS